jgi:hypothetical protein
MMVSVCLGLLASPHVGTMRGKGQVIASDPWCAKEFCIHEGQDPNANNDCDTPQAHDSHRESRSLSAIDQGVDHSVVASRRRWSTVQDGLTNETEGPITWEGQGVGHWPESWGEHG